MKNADVVHGKNKKIAVGCSLMKKSEKNNLFEHNLPLSLFPV